MCRSTNLHTIVEPEVWFRILHVAADGRDGVRVAPYHEQTVEIALGPKGAFGKGTVGALTRWVPAERVVSAVPARRARPKPPSEPKTPRVDELLRKALQWQALLESGQVANQAAIARCEGITRARVTQVMGLLRLAPEIQQYLLALRKGGIRRIVTERALRRITHITDPRTQVAEFEALLRCNRRTD